MNLSVIEKLGVIFKYLFSSFLSIELFIISFLLLIILIINIKRKNIFVQIIAVGIFLGFVLGIFISYTTYVKSSIDSFVKAILNYIYFPSTIVYFFIMVFVTVMLVYSLFSKKIGNVKRIINFATFCLLYFFFMSFLSLSSYNAIDLIDLTSLYENNIILSLVQVSNWVLFIWLIYTGFYHLYLFFKKKFDK